MVDVLTITKPSCSAAYLAICPSLSLFLLTSTKFPRIQNITFSGLPIKAPTKPPIHVAHKHRGSRKRLHKYVSPLFDSRGHPDPQDNWEVMPLEVKAGYLICK